MSPDAPPSLALRALSAQARLRLETLPPLSLYLHFPWCLRKCPYCDFNSHALQGELPEADYVAALLADLEMALPAIWGRRVLTVFLGGGTPSLFSPAAIATLLSGLRARLAGLPGAEITLEANPGTFEAERFQGYREAGVTRLSLGVQSFDEAKLAALGRVHGAREAHAAAASAVQIFPATNFDLMFALPGQNEAAALADVDAALAYAPQHLSCYHLSIEPNTWFARHPPVLPDGDAAAAIEDAVRVRLAAAGFLHYEVSAHARPGFLCRHNLNYWRFGDYLGLGAGAHGKISFPDRILRQTRARSPKDYLAAVAAGRPVEGAHEVAARDLGFEFALNALRLKQGVPLALFAERTGLTPAALLPALSAARARGLLVSDPLRLVATPLGQRFLDDLVGLFLPEATSSATSN
ncbi:Heme chaperone HemW [Burkholderiales bacterium]|nr:MAG: oxygen-independent coproporphyrinogen III oxidase-like protein [Burkholderiales bacterium]CAG0976179.1 Heme chaperone HemW [Burkholderiales bacterium]